MFDRVGAWFRPPPARGPSVATATVVDNHDPKGEGRVLIVVQPAAGGDGGSWARTSTLMAGPDRGTWFVPDVGDEVVVSYDEGGRPVVLGSLWSAQARPPEEVGDDNARRAIVTRSGARIVIDDAGGSCVIRLATAHGQHVTLDDGGVPNTVTIADDSGSSIELSAAGVSVTSSARITVMATEVTVSAGTVRFEAGMVEATGILKCSTLIADSVVANSYTPGAGNIW